MAATFISAPGTEYGPCVEACSHSDCDASRRIATKLCRICRESIGYERNYYQDGENLMHAICLEEELEAKSK